MAGRDSASVYGGLAAAAVVVDSGVRNWRASEWQKRRWQQTALFFALLCFLVNFVASDSDPGESKCTMFPVSVPYSFPLSPLGLLELLAFGKLSNGPVD
jgi:hypothetical protein